MNLTRRDALASLGTLAASAAFNRLESAPISPSAQRFLDSVVPEFPRKADFNIAQGFTSLSAAFSHPISKPAAEAYHRAVEQRTTLAPPGVPFVFLNPPP